MAAGTGKFVVLFDADAKSELRRLRLGTVFHLPRIGETIELAAERELGGGAYDVVDVIHQFADDDGHEAKVHGIIISVRPRRDDGPAALADAIPDVVPLEALAIGPDPAG